MSSINKLDPGSAPFLPTPINQFEIPDYMNIFGTDFAAGFPGLAMEQDHFQPEQHTGPQHDPSALDTPIVTLEIVQRDMWIAFNSFMRLQNEYHAKLQCVERELARNVQEAKNLRQDVDVLSDWAKAVLNHFGNEGTMKEAKAVSQDQNPVR